ncbi:MAG TPA: DnaJ domain-containing protein, partial [Polyangiales bacterium]|nr:DnaJ domain-containing protein [Polyangiales bacterium]
MTARIPKLVSGVDVFSLPLSTREGFVLSRIDGVSSVEDISLMVGIKATELGAILDKLADLGAVELPWRPKKSVTPPAPTRDEPENIGRQIGQAAIDRLLATPLVPLYDELEVLAKADISIELRKKILNGYYGLDGKDYYQLLGVARSADKKEIKSAYFELSKLFHPDSQFGRELGTFKAKMETVFKRLTEAYEVLGRNARRKEYDEYLAATETTIALQQGFDQVQHEVEALDATPANPAISAQPTAAADERNSRPAGEAQRSHSAADENEWPVSNAPSRTLIPPPTPEARREAARPIRPPASIEDRKAQARQRLRRGLPAASGLRSTFPPVADRHSAPDPANTNAAERRDSAIRGLRQGLRQTGQNSGVDPVMTHLRKARDAEQAGDLLGAASALQAALSLQPNHKDIQAQYARVSKAVTRNLAD